MAFRLDSIISKLFRFRGSKAEGQFYIRPDDDNLIVGKGTDITDTSSHVLTLNSTSGSISGSFTGSFSGSLVQATEINISEMGGLVIAEQYQHDASTGVFVDLTTTMGAPTGAPSITFICPANGKVKIQISGYVVHSGQPTESHTTAEVAIHDGSGYVYDIDGIQLDSQQFWASVGDNYMQTIEFIITKDSSDVALVPGTSYTFQSHWRGSINTEIKIYYGANMPPLIMRAVTVPNTIL